MKSRKPARFLLVRSVIVSLTLFGTLLLTATPAVASRAATSGTGHVEEKTQEPTTLAISLEGAAQSGASITVPEETHVTGTPTLGGPNAASARGPASYKIYSDSGCTAEAASAGMRGVHQGGQSRAVRLPPGTYYWQASYGGDAINQPSVSACGAAIETVEGGPPPAPCSRAWGEMRVSTDEGHLGVREDVSTNLSAHQRLYAWWSGKHRLRLTRLLDASCIAKTKVSVFHGRGEARLDGVPGYLVSFAVRVAKSGVEVVRLHVHNARHEGLVSLTGFATPGSEIIG